MSAVEQVRIPEKLFYRINEVSSIAQVKPYVLRYWESEFPMLSPEKDENDQRRYRRSDIELILQIKNLLYVDKFTIAGARKQLKQSREAAAPAKIAIVQDAPSRMDVQKYRKISRSINDLRKEVGELFTILQ